ncbi:MAG: hypothetical protein IRZ24_18965 [Thermogemmatispora sp.]|jgi:hypothetical protein|nr:hypothetical protein [Thermogemmatispora sp.]MBX5452152.1 hypothetical protein [Thermogemmatispora sp.]
METYYGLSQPAGQPLHPDVVAFCTLLAQIIKRYLKEQEKGSAHAA